MDTVLTKNEVQAQLQAKSDEIARRLDALQDEVISAPDSVRKALSKNPYVGVGGAIAAGLLVGLLVGGSKKKKGKVKLNSASAQGSLVEAYMRALAEDAANAAKAGADTDDAVQNALRNRVPLIVYAPGETQEKGGLIGDAFGLVFKTAMGFAVKIGMDYLTARFNLDELMGPLQTHGGADAAPAVGAFTSED